MNTPLSRPVRPQHPAARVGLFLVGYLVILRLSAVPKAMAPPPLADLVWGTVSAVLILSLALFMLRREGRARADVGMAIGRGSVPRLALGAVIGLGMYAATLATIAVIAGPMGLRATHAVSAQSLTLAALSFLALSAMEELGFRGYALRTLEDSIGRWPAQLLIALLFGLSHLLFGWTWQAALFGVVPSALLFGAAAGVSRGLAMPIGLHAAVNVAQWSVSQKDAVGLWTLSMDPEATVTATRVGPVIGACMSLLFCALLWLWPRATRAFASRASAHA